MTGFRNLYVFRRETNLGAKENSRDLISWIREKYDSYIYMEDDLEVSPNYLDYLHKGKLKFLEDSNVFAICGYSHRNDYNCGKKQLLSSRRDVFSVGILDYVLTAR